MNMVMIKWNYVNEFDDEYVNEWIKPCVNEYGND